LRPEATIRLFEACDRLGGPLHTLRTADTVLELGADSFLIKTPWALELCRELGLADQLIPTNERHRRALVVCRGRVVPVPDGFVLMRPQNLSAMLRSPVLSAAGKVRLLAEPLMSVPAEAYDADYDESVASFATRRLGRETYERLVQPLIAGVFVADARSLSLAATFPEFLKAEREYGSLLGSRSAGSTAASQGGSDADNSGAKQPTAARYGQFVTLRRGMRQLVEALADALPDGAIRLRSPACSVRRVDGGKWRVETTGAPPDEPFDGVVLATAAFQAARLVQDESGPLSHLLSRIEYASSAVIALRYHRDQIRCQLDGFGVVAPDIERRAFIAASFLTVKFPHTAPAGEVVLRVFVGGVLHPEMVDRSDADLIATATGELGQLFPIEGGPRDVHVARWRNSMPQYHVGHLKLANEIEAVSAGLRGLQLSGSGYRGVGMPQCVRSGQQAAEHLISQLDAGPVCRT
jgi:oxygen-dependent protoporphyrinogen oxidase